MSATQPKISAAFDGHKAFIPFITCGDPDLETTEELVCALADAGADLIELGIPFSDPTAEGVVIQAANLRALEAHTTTDAVFAMVERVRDKVDVPLVFMTYANVVYGYGSERFCTRAEQIGMSGLILPDVPFEEKEEFSGVCNEHGLELVSLIAPTSHERTKMIAAEAQGFIYAVSSLGVTGTRENITTDISAMVAAVREASDLPVAVGFGISNPEQAAEMAAQADGAIVGSALVNIVGEHGRDAVGPVREAAAAMAEAVHAL
ncbi:MAG: tryptophan synthase subunit alpha [Coriobacteriaceae bacterium]|nr:tryptophan synthase subunit alpha [Coriobacteriaceae bacterium]